MDELSLFSLASVNDQSSLNNYGYSASGDIGACPVVTA